MRAVSPLDFQGVRPQSTVSPKMQRMRIKPSEEVQWELISLLRERGRHTPYLFGEACFRAWHMCLHQKSNSSPCYTCSAGRGPESQARLNARLFHSRVAVYPKFCKDPFAVSRIQPTLRLNGSIFTSGLIRIFHFTLKQETLDFQSRLIQKVIVHLISFYNFSLCRVIR